MKSKKVKWIALFACIVIVVLLAVVVVNNNNNKETGKDKSGDSEKEQIELKYDGDNIVIDEDEGEWVVDEDSTGESKQSSDQSSNQTSDEEISTPSEPEEESPSSEDVESDKTENLGENVLPIQPLS